MSRTNLPLSQECIAPFDREMFVHEAAKLHQRPLEAFTTPFPKAPPRWVSHDHFRPRPLEFTAAGAVEGGSRGLMGATSAVSCTRALWAPSSAKAGGHCYDPARAFCLEVASRVDRYPDSARCCADLRQQEKGRR